MEGEEQLAQRACPFCAVPAPAGAKLCGSCNRYLPPPMPPRSIGPARLPMDFIRHSADSLSQRLEQLLVRCAEISESIGVAQAARHLPRARRPVAVGLVAIAILYLIYWVGSSGGSYPVDVEERRYLDWWRGFDVAKSTLLILGLAGFLWFAPFTRKSGSPAVPRGASDPMLLGFPVDLVIGQIALLCSAIVLDFEHADFGLAEWLCWTAAALAVPLYGTRKWLWSLPGAVVAIVYGLALASAENDLFHREQLLLEMAGRRSYVNLEPYFLILAICMVFPFVQRFGAGRLKGDVSVNLFGFYIFAPFSTAALLAAAWSLRWLPIWLVNLIG